jgi:hypothetical protein
MSASPPLHLLPCFVVDASPWPARSFVEDSVGDAFRGPYDDGGTRSAKSPDGTDDDAERGALLELQRGDVEDQQVATLVELVLEGLGQAPGVRAVALTRRLDQGLVTVVGDGQP